MHLEDSLNFYIFYKLFKGIKSPFWMKKANSAYRTVDGKDAWDNDQLDELIREMRRTGNQELREKLILAHQGLVGRTAGYFSGNGLDAEDLIGYGTIGLIQYIDEKYKPYRKGRNFKAGAISWIKREMRRGIQEKGAIKVASRNVSNSRGLIKLREDYYKQNGREPSIEYLAREMRISVEKVSKFYLLLNPISSLDQGINPDFDEGLARFLEDPSSQEDALLMEERDEVSRLLEKADLNPNERKLLQERYGLYGGARKSFKQMGRECGRTKQRVEQKVRETLKKVKIANGIVA